MKIYLVQANGCEKCGEDECSYGFYVSKDRAKEEANKYYNAYVEEIEVIE